MITREEREEIINEAMERTLLRIPEIIGNLITTHAEKMRANKKFYSDHPEFKNHKDIVAAVIERVESLDSSFNVEEILNKAVPEIKKRISTLKTLDMEAVKKPSIDFSHGEL